MFVNYVVNHTSCHRVKPQRKVQIQESTWVLGHMAAKLVEREKLPVYGLIFHDVVATILFHVLKKVLCCYWNQLCMQQFKLFLHETHAFIFHFGSHDVQNAPAFADEGYLQAIRSCVHMPAIAPEVNFINFELIKVRRRGRLKCHVVFCFFHWFLKHAHIHNAFVCSRF